LANRTGRITVGELAPAEGGARPNGACGPRLAPGWRNVDVPVYFTVQPGAAYVSTPNGYRARLVYPNYRRQSPGRTMAFWHYDPEERGWYVYGEGTVTPDGHQIVPNRGVGLYEFTGAMVGPPSLAPLLGLFDPAADGEPVNLGTGLFITRHTDLAVPDVLPINFERVYRPLDAASRAFGIGASHVYDTFLVGDTGPYTYIDLVLASGQRIHYARISSGTGYGDACEVPGQ
jgi:hypothetical protein